MSSYSSYTKKAKQNNTCVHFFQPAPQKLECPKSTARGLQSPRPLPLFKFISYLRLSHTVSRNWRQTTALVTTICGLTHFSFNNKQL